jgi:hypothetical protein
MILKFCYFSTEFEKLKTLGLYILNHSNLQIQKFSSNLK